MINNAQNTNFKSRIVVSQTAYNALPLASLSKQGKVVDTWTPKGAKFLKEDGFTSRIEDCTAGIIKAKGGDEFYMFHFDPKDKTENDWDKVEETLIAAQGRLRKANPNTPLEGFLVGAKIGYKSSVDQAWNLLNFLQDTGVKVSSLLLQAQNGVSNIHYSLPKDEMTICFNTFMSPRNEDELAYKFSHIEPDGDMFEFRGD